MAQDIIISQQDIDDAETFLTEYLTERVPEGNFARGTAMRDLAIRAFSYLFAFLRNEVSFITLRQSLLKIQNSGLTDDDDIAGSVDEVMSNWFISRKGGQISRLTALLHFKSKTDISIPLSTKFWRTVNYAFYIDVTSSPYLIPASTMRPTFDSRGNLVDYVATVPMRAARSGEDYDFEPGTFVFVEASSGIPYLSYVEHTTKASGGAAVEDTEEMLERSTTAIAIRNLINNRSCDAVLQEVFVPVTRTMTIGMGEPEMIRDVRTEIASHIKLHTGGHYDTYVDMPLTNAEENGTVAGYFLKPDGVVNVLRDPAFTYGISTFVLAGVQVGHIIRIMSGIIESPREYQIVEVADHELFVSPYTPFSEASDELDTNAVEYSVGGLAPGFVDIIIPRVAVSFGGVDALPGTSRRVSEPGLILLSGRPVQDIISVEVTDPDAGMTNLVDPSMGTVVFRERVNGPPAPTAVSTDLQYQVRVYNPSEAQSMRAVVGVYVGWGDDFTPPNNPSRFDGKNLKVTYRTLAGIENVNSFVIDRDERVLAANHLIKARHPVWIEFTLPYRMKPTAGSIVDETGAANMLSDYINKFDPSDNLDMSDLATKFRTSFLDVGTVFPFDINYVLHSPDGQLIKFKTTDIVSIFMTTSNGVELQNGPDILVPDDMRNRGITIIDTPETLKDYFKLRGISDRTVLYRSRADLITFELRG